MDIPRTRSHALVVVFLLRKKKKRRQVDPPPMDGYRVVNTYAHTKESFTQVSKP
jgi:hypothetical protein